MSIHPQTLNSTQSEIESRQERLFNALILSSSLLTERMLLYSSFLPALDGRMQTELWTTSNRNLDFAAANGNPRITIKPFPAVKPFKEFPYNHLRRLNEFAWDYRLRPPSRSGTIKDIRDKDTRFYIRALKAPARALASLGMEKALEDWLETVLLSYQRSPESAQRFASSEPDVLVTTGTFRFEEPAVTAAAMNKGIPTLAFITSWDNPSTKNRMVFKYDGYLVWSEQMKQDLYHFFPYTREKPVYVIGAPQFDVFFQPQFHESRESFCARHSLDHELPIILYALGSPNLFRENASVLYLAERVAGGEFGESQLLIRPHPLHDRGLDLAALRHLGPRVAVQETGQTGLSVPTRAQNEEQIRDWVNTFRHADVIVNLSSTAAIDGAIFDKPVVNLDYDPEPGQPRQVLVKEINHSWTHFKPVAESGGMWLVASPEEMVDAVRTYLDHPELHREQRREMAERVCGFLDGRCGERMAEALLDFTTTKKRPEIVAILPRGEAIRNFVYTGALDELSTEANLTLLSVVPNERLWASLQERFDRLIPLREHPERWIVRFIREVLDVAHGRWLWSRGAQARWQWRDREATTLPAWLKRSGKKLLSYPFISRSGLEALSGLEMLSSRWLRATDEYTRLFRQLKPALVFNGSQVHSRIALPAVHAAIELGIPTATFLFSWDNLTSQGRIHPQPDYFIVWNEALRDGLIEIYGSLRPEQIFITGTPQFDFHFRPEFYWPREEFCARVGADPDRPIVLYSTGMANHITGEPWVVEQIADLLREMTEFGPPQLLVRILPKGPQNHFDDLKRRRKEIIIPQIPWEPSWLTPTPEDAYLLTNTLRHCAVGINIASTISLELCMFDKPVINIGFPPPHLDPAKEFDYTRYYDFEHYRPVVASGAIEMAYSKDDLREKIVRALKHPEERAPQRAALLRSFFGDSLDGRSSSRVTRALLEMASRPFEREERIRNKRK